MGSQIYEREPAVAVVVAVLNEWGRPREATGWPTTRSELAGLAGGHTEPDR